MWGIEFHEGTKNSLIVAIAEFEVRGEDRRDNAFYCVRMGPYDTAIDRMNSDGEWETINSHAEPEDIEAILPQNMGCEWTYGDFMIALTFFGEGYNVGYAHGQYDR